MTCARFELGMSDNCALCENQQPDMYDPCRGHPEKVQRPIIKTKEKEIIVIPVKETIQELSHDETRKQIIDYIQTVGGRVHVSEIAENLNMDIELVTEILDES